MTPVPWRCWLIIVSTAMAVLPVWRSPIKSSRWPRPIGTMASMAVMPVIIGSWTDFLSSTPGALRSTRLEAVALIGPLPSIGWPSGLTTRPTSSGPTGTSSTRPDSLAVAPALMSVSSPSSTAPISSCPRLKAKAVMVLPSKPWISIISL